MAAFQTQPGSKKTGRAGGKGSQGQMSALGARAPETSLADIDIQGGENCSAAGGTRRV